MRLSLASQLADVPTQRMLVSRFVRVEICPLLAAGLAIEIGAVGSREPVASINTHVLPDRADPASRVEVAVASHVRNRRHNPSLSSSNSNERRS
jgi:hypothetical protein